MIESSRRHGHWDGRWNAQGRSPTAVANGRTNGGSATLQRWEDEGGRYSVDGADAAAALDWTEFIGRYFPGRRRHDFEALTAYEAYRPERLSERPAPRSRRHGPRRAR
jgi:hypothetical protein